MDSRSPSLSTSIIQSSQSSHSCFIHLSLSSHRGSRDGRTVVSGDDRAPPPTDTTTHHSPSPSPPQVTHKTPITDCFPHPHGSNSPFNPTSISLLPMSDSTIKQSPFTFCLSQTYVPGYPQAIPKSPMLLVFPTSPVPLLFFSLFHLLQSPLLTPFLPTVGHSSPLLTLSFTFSHLPSSPCQSSLLPRLISPSRCSPVASTRVTLYTIHHPARFQ